MSDLLRRITARNRGHQKGNIRPVLPAPAFQMPAVAETPGRFVEPRASAEDRLPPALLETQKPATEAVTDTSSMPPSATKTTAETPTVSSDPSRPQPTQSTPKEAAFQVKLERIVESMPAFADNKKHASRVEKAPAAAPQKQRQGNARGHRGMLPPVPRPLVPSPDATPIPAEPPVAPAVEISIGTVEVGVVPPPSANSPAPIPRPRPAPRLSLDAYLRRRNRPAAGGPS